MCVCVPNVLVVGFSVWLDVTNIYHMMRVCWVYLCACGLMGEVGLVWVLLLVEINIYIYTHIYICVCLCVCVYVSIALRTKRHTRQGAHLFVKRSRINIYRASDSVPNQRFAICGDCIGVALWWFARVCGSKKKHCLRNYHCRDFKLLAVLISLVLVRRVHDPIV